MSSTSVSTAQEHYQQYRAVSMLAVTTFAVAILSLPAIVFPKLLILPAAGVLLGAYSWVAVKRRSDELSGLTLIRYGVILCAAVLIGGLSYSSYVYLTEVPEGYRRIQFYQLQPDANHPGMPIPPSALELDGKRVFVRGFVHPGVDRRTGIKQFVLVPDMKTCCFGGQPKLTDMIEVTLRDPLRISYSVIPRKLAGTLRVSNQKKQVSGLDGVYYQLDADYVR